LPYEPFASHTLRRRLTNQRLPDGGYTVIAAKDGGEALKAIEKYRPDLIILDRMLPHIGGWR